MRGGTRTQLARCRFGEAPRKAGRGVPGVIDPEAVSMEDRLASFPVNVGIVGLGRWAKVLTRAARQSDKIRIVSGYSRSPEERQAFAQEMGVPAAPDMATMLANPDIVGVILTVPNEQHFPLAAQVARAGKHVYTE